MGDRRALFIQTLRELGEVYILTGNYKKALGNFRKLFENADDDVLIEVEAKRHIAGVFEKLGKYDKAFEVINRIEKVLCTFPDKKIERADIIIFKAMIHRIVGRIEMAINESKQGIRMINESGALKIGKRANRIKIARLLANAYNNLGVLYYMKCDFDKAIKLYKKHLEISAKIHDKQGIGQASNNLANIYCEKGDYERAIEVYQKSLRVLGEIGYKQGVGQASCNMGLAYCEKGDYIRAVRLFQEHLKISKEIGYIQGIAVAYSNLGLAYYNKGDYQEAIRFYQKSLRILENIGNKYGMGLEYLNLGNVYREKGDYNTAIEHYRKYLSISKKLNDNYGIGAAKLNLGVVFLDVFDQDHRSSVNTKGELRSFDSRIKLIEEYLRCAEKIFLKLKDQENLIAVLVGLARLQTKMKYFSKKLPAHADKVSSRNSDHHQSIDRILKKYADKILKCAGTVRSPGIIAGYYLAYGKVLSLMLHEINSTSSINISNFSILKSNIKLALTVIKKAIKIYTTLRRKKLLADCLWEYGRILRYAGNKGSGISWQYIYKALKVYKELRLKHRMREIVESVS